MTGNMNLQSYWVGKKNGWKLLATSSFSYSRKLNKSSTRTTKLKFHILTKFQLVSEPNFFTQFSSTRIFIKIISNDDNSKENLWMSEVNSSCHSSTMILHSTYLQNELKKTDLVLWLRKIEIEERKTAFFWDLSSRLQYLDTLQIDSVHHCALKKRHCGVVTF